MVFELESETDIVLQAEESDRLHVRLGHRVLGNRFSVAVGRAGAVDRSVDIHRQIFKQTVLQKGVMAAGVDNDFDAFIHGLAKIPGKPSGHCRFAGRNDCIIDVAYDQAYILCTFFHI